MRTTAERLREVWSRTDELFALLPPSAVLDRPIPLRHPFVFYLGHLPAFAWAHVAGGVLARGPFDARLDEVFSRGIDPDVDDPTRCHDHPEVPARWPALADVLAYRDGIRAALLAAADELDDPGTDGGAARDAAVAIAVEHEAMHQETLCYMLQRLPVGVLRRPAGAADPAPGRGRPVGPVFVPAGRAMLGAVPGTLPFGWDNEFPALEQAVPAFRIDGTPVTTAAFAEFVAAGGYARRELWRDEDWTWVRQRAQAHPLNWAERDGRRWYRTLFDEVLLDDVADWPVFVSQAEARAFARWRGGRLPTEGEYHRAAFGAPAERACPYPWGDAEPTPAHGNFGLVRWTPMAVGTHDAGASAWGVHDLVGDGWEWTETPFAGFPGFEPMPAYPGYSADFFDGKHYVLKGASWATPRELVRPTFRNWFQARYPYPFAKFRCVTSA